MSATTPNNPAPGKMQVGTSAKTTGGLSEKRVVHFTAGYFKVPIDEVLFQPLTPDASTRKYYRVASAGRPDETLIISLYPTPFNQQDNSFVDVTNLFERAGLPVPRIIEVADTDGIILQEDLGDMSLSRWLTEAGARGDFAGCEEMLRRAIDLIVRIQSATTLAYAIGSVASKHAFDEDKLSWELNYFFTHYFGSYRELNLAESEVAAIREDLQRIARELSARPRFLTHRDYHGMNLMIDGRGELRIIDHQDARMGPVTYDLVPLLVERRLEPAEEQWVEEHQRLFLTLRRQGGLPVIDPRDLQYEFHLMTIQRQLKAVGTFSYQTAVVGRGEAYEKYIPPAIATVLRAMKAAGMPDYPALRKALDY